MNERIKLLFVQQQGVHDDTALVAIREVRFERAAELWKRGVGGDLKREESIGFDDDSIVKTN